MTNLLQTMIGLTIVEATRLEDTQSTYFEFSNAALAVFGSMKIFPEGESLENFVGDTISKFLDEDPSAVIMEFRSNRRIVFDVLGTENDPSPERICYRNLNTSPPINDMVKQIDDFFRTESS